MSTAVRSSREGSRSASRAVSAASALGSSATRHQPRSDSACAESVLPTGVPGSAGRTSSVTPPGLLDRPAQSWCRLAPCSRSSERVSCRPQGECSFSMASQPADSTSLDNQWVAPTKEEIYDRLLSAGERLGWYFRD